MAMIEDIFGTLAFLVTLAVFIMAGLFLIYALLTRRLAIVWKISAGLLAWAGIYLAILLSVSLLSPAPTLQPGQVRCFGEMCFTVTHVRVTKTLGEIDHPLVAKGVFYVLTVRLQNTARQATQRPDHPRLWIVAQDGSIYPAMIDPHSIQGQPAGAAIPANTMWDQQLQPGKATKRTLVFDLPVDATGLRLVIAEGSWPTPLIIGDENSFFHARTTFNLSPLVHSVP
jgi:hypothetical protein